MFYDFNRITSWFYTENKVVGFCSVFYIASKSAISEWKEFKQTSSENVRSEINIKDLYNKRLTEYFAYFNAIKQIIEIINTILSNNAKVKHVLSNISHILDDGSLSMAKEFLECRLQIN